MAAWVLSFVPGLIPGGRLGGFGRAEHRPIALRGSTAPGTRSWPRPWRRVTVIGKIHVRDRRVMPISHRATPPLSHSSGGRRGAAPAADLCSTVARWPRVCSAWRWLCTIYRPRTALILGLALARTGTGAGSVGRFSQSRSTCRRAAGRARRGPGRPPRQRWLPASAWDSFSAAVSWSARLACALSGRCWSISDLRRWKRLARPHSPRHARAPLGRLAGRSSAAMFKPSCSSE